MQILSVEIPKVQKKDSQVVSLLVIFGSARVKAARKMSVKLTPGTSSIL